MKQDQCRISDFVFDMLDGRPAQSGLLGELVLGNSLHQPDSLELGNNTAGKILRLGEVQISYVLT